MQTKVSIVIPMFNAERHIRQVIEGLLHQDFTGEKEIIVVDDGSTDRSPEIVREYEKRGDLRVLHQTNLGAVAATNAGFREAAHDIVCSIDSDIVLHPDWLRIILKEFDDPAVGAVQGYIKTPAGMPFIARMAGYDLEYRYDQLQSGKVTQVSTANTAYRRTALEKTGFFDPRFAYGYDNDMSYRLQKAGLSLVFQKEALCEHYWKATLKGYVLQQYRSAYGRMQLIRKHTDRISGDSVSGLRMIGQVPLTLLTLLLLLFGGGIALAGGPSAVLWGGCMLLAVMLADRSLYAIAVAKKQKDYTALAMPAVHLLRNLVWVAALIVWTIKREKA